MTTVSKLPIESLKLHIDLSSIDLEEASMPHAPILGQTRAQSALEFGVAMTRPGYNIYVMGELGLGRLSMINQHLNALAEKQPAPPSYAYADNFQNPREPVAIELPPEYCAAFSADIEQLIDNLLATFPAAFESPTYQQKKTAIERQFNQYYNNAIDKVDQKALSMSIALFRESEQISFAPIRKAKPSTTHSLRNCRKPNGTPSTNRSRNSKNI